MKSRIRREPDMQTSRTGKNSENKLEVHFGVIEQRVKALVEENKGLKVRVAELEEGLEQAKRDAVELEHFHGKKLHIKEKIERILQQLDAVGIKK
jgi:uncharacterized protein YdcH (DUF465 family)